MPAFPAVPSFLKAAEILAVHEAAFRCMHYRPLEIQHMDFPVHYPWAIHSGEPLPWDAIVDGSFSARNKCSLTTTTPGGACGECADLQHNAVLKGITATMRQNESKRRESEKPPTMIGRPDHLCSLTVMRLWLVYGRGGRHNRCKLLTQINVKLERLLNTHGVILEFRGTS